MTEDFNPYRAWLELDLAGQPESDYELLRLRDFENDQPSIQAAADRAIAKVRSFRPGAQAAAWSKLLDELSGAKKKLTDPTLKSQYDAEVKARRANGSANAGEGSTKETSPQPTSASIPAAPLDPRYPPGFGATAFPAAASPAAPLEASNQASTGYNSSPAAHTAVSPQATFLPVTPHSTNPVAAIGQPMGPVLGSVGIDYSSLASGTAPTAAPSWGYGAPQQPQPAYNAPQPNYNQPNHSQPAYAQPGYGQPAGYGQQPAPYVHPQALPASPQGYGGWNGGAQPQVLPALPMQPQAVVPTATAYAQPMPGNGWGQPAPLQAAPGYYQPQSYQQQPQPQPYQPQYQPTPTPPPPAPPAVEGYAEYLSHAAAAHFDPMAPIDPMAPVNYGNAETSSLPLGTAVDAVLATANTLPLPSGTAVLPEQRAESKTVASMNAETAGAETKSPQTETQLATPQVSSPSATQAAAARSRGLPLVTMLMGAAAAAIGLIIILVVSGSLGTPDENIETAQNNQPEAIPETPRPQPKKPDERPKTNPIKPRPQPMPEQPPKVEVMKPVPEPMPEPMVPAPMPEPMPKPTPEPEPKPVPKPEPVKLPTKQEVAALTEAMKTARLALTEGNVEEAQTQLAKVESITKLPEHQKMFERLKMLTDYNGQFWNAVAEAVKSFKSGSELMVGSQVLVVVEAGPDFLILRIAGKNQRFPIRELKAGIAVAVADQWFQPNDPAALVMKGAYAAVNRLGNVERAKEWWEQAKAAGVDTSSLVPVIDDTYENFAKDLDQAIMAQGANP